MKKKMLIFNPALAPYMIDQYNDLNQIYDLEVVFLFANVPYFKYNQSKLLLLLKCKYSFLLKGICYKERVFRLGMLNIIRRKKPDIIIGYEYSFTTQYLILFKKIGLIHQQIGSTIDDSLEICNHVQSKVRFFAREISVKRLDYLIVLSKEVSEFYRNRFNLQENKIIVSPILQNPQRLRNNPGELEKIANEYTIKYKLKDKKVLLFVGRFVEVKGLIRFIKTTNPVLFKDNKVVFILVGDGEDKNDIEALIKEKHLENKILLPGKYDEKELYAWYICSSGFVLPSTYEPFGAVVNEALIFGNKVFCSKYAGASYLIQSDSGIVFDPLNENETIDKLNIFLNSIDVIKEIDMENKPSLMSDTQKDFIEEWTKIIKN
ncbi:MAG: glycosyltransferase [Paludibacter sp.]|nr:glycosyltransferase [Paludibacter sp.]